MAKKAPFYKHRAMQGVALAAGAVLLVGVVVLSSGNNSPSAVAVQAVAPTAQTAGWFSNLVNGITNVFNSIGSALQDPWCSTFGYNFQNLFGSCDTAPPAAGSSACTSAPNVCGMTNSGTWVSITSQTDRESVSTSCSATPPPNSACPATTCTSAPNACGMTNTATVPYGSACAASAPSDAACNPCTSPANSCGMTNNGYIVGGSCTASAPADSVCPAPSFGQGFYASPDKVGRGGQSTLHWTVANATTCTLTSDTGFGPYNGGSQGSVSSGELNDTTTFTLSCKNGTGPQKSTSLRVQVDPKIIEI